MENNPEVIFVTAYPEYAVSAFELDAADYLLKPVEPARLGKAIEKLRRLNRKSQPEAKPELVPQNRPNTYRIDCVPAGKEGKTILVTESDIFYAFTLQDSVYLKTETDKLFTRFTLKELETRLSNQSFFRTHRCYLVNLHKVQEIVPFFNGTYNLVVTDKERSEVPVSRAQAKKLKGILGL
jgi:two-component system LytT family response regulator